MDDSRDISNQADLVRRLCHALKIARNAVSKLGSESYYDPDQPDHKLEPEKLIAETALLLLAVSSGPVNAEIDALLCSIAEMLAPLARSEKALVGLCFQPSLALDYSLAHICLSRLGYPDASFDRLLEKSAAREWQACRERLPYRALEQEWIRRLWRGGASKTTLREKHLLRTSMIAGPLDVLCSTRDDLYAFTHTLLYVTDLGRRSIRLPRSHALIAIDAEVALARCLDDEDYDVAGELLLTWPFLRRQWSPGAAFAFSVLKRVEDQAGFLPTPATRVDKCESLRGPERSRYLLATAYHTVYVMGLLCSAALRHPQPSARVRAKGPCNRALLDGLGEILLRDPSRPHWVEDYTRLKHSEQAPLARLVFAAVAWRSAKNRDVSALYRVLENAQRCGMRTDALHRQIARLLQRLTIFSSLPRVSQTAVGLPA
jgi:hypothetical protein